MRSHVVALATAIALGVLNHTALAESDEHGDAIVFNHSLPLPVTFLGFTSDRHFVDYSGRRIDPRRLQSKPGEWYSVKMSSPAFVSLLTVRNSDGEVLLTVEEDVYVDPPVRAEGVFQVPEDGRFQIHGTSNDDWYGGGFYIELRHVDALE